MTSILLAMALAATPPPTSGWRFVLPDAGDPFEHAPFRALVLSREKPEDLVEKVVYRGDPSRRRYAQIRYGSPGSVRVTVVLDEVNPGAADLYVDADRNRRIDDRDRVNPTPSASPRERLWRRPMDVAMVEKDETRKFPRALVFRLGASGRTLGYASAGYLEGTIDLVDAGGRPRPVRARRVDGDGNGLLADPQDRLWIDLDGDGRFDPAAEQFLFSTVLHLGGARYVVRSDELGTRLGVEPLVGVGTLRLSWKGGTPAELHATVLGRDGSVYGLEGTEPASIPVGEYRLGTVTIAMNDPAGGPRWSFIFSDNGARGEPRWYKVNKDGAAAIDPIGKTQFQLDLRDGDRGRRPGDDVPLQPLLYTEDALLINIAYRGAPASPALQETLGARISLRRAESAPALSSAHSGFA